MEPESRFKINFLLFKNVRIHIATGKGLKDLQAQATSSNFLIPIFFYMKVYNFDISNMDYFIGQTS